MVIDVSYNFQVMLNISSNAYTPDGISGDRWTNASGHSVKASVSCGADTGS